MFAARILPVAVFLPIGLIHQLPEGCMMLIGDQIARAFPTANIASRVTPRGARKLTFAAQEFQVDGRCRQFVFAKKLLSFLELGPDVVAGEEYLGGPLGVRLLNRRIAVGR